MPPTHRPTDFAEALEGPPLLIATHFTQKLFRSDNRNEAQIGFSADNRQAGRRY